MSTRRERLLAGALATALSSAALATSGPLALVSDVPLPGPSSRFDYADIDSLRGRLVLAHMGAGEVAVIDLRDGATLKRLPGIGTVRGVRVAARANLIFATAAATNELVRIDATTLSEIGRTATGSGPDGVDWDPSDHVVAVSDQRDGAISLIGGDGAGPRRQVRLGAETGNVVFDPARSWFWITVVKRWRSDQLVAIDPISGLIRERLALPGCRGAHGLRLHPDGRTALVACEDNDLLARVELAVPHEIATAQVGSGPDVLAADPALALLYVAAEDGELTVFDLGRAGLVTLGRQHAGDDAHSVAVDPTTHRVYFPLAHGPGGGPVLRVMQPAR